MPISNGDRVYSFAELLKEKDSKEDTFKGLPGLLADLLPDKYGNRLIDKWLDQSGRPMGSMNPVEKLCFIGNRGMGALEFEPAQLKAEKNTFSIEISGLVDIAKEMLSDRQRLEAKLSKDEQRAMQDILKIGTSAGGARPKALVTYNKKTGQIRSGQTKAPKGFEHWLLKLDGVSGAQFGESYGWGRVEYAYYLMAKACQIDMMDCELLEENDTKHHIQTLCGIQHFDYNDMYGFSYEQVFQTMRQLRLKYPEAEQMFRRMVFNVLATNYDDHTKNFSFRLKKGERWELAPAYDVCYSYDPTNHWVSQQTLSVNGKHKDISKSDLLTIAKANNIKKGENSIIEINDVIKDWSAFAKQAKVRDDLFKEIQSNHNTM